MIACQMVVIRCDWCGCLSGKDGAWTVGGFFGHGICHGEKCCGEKESPEKSNQVIATSVMGLSCALGSLMVPVERRGDG